MKSMTDLRRRIKMGPLNFMSYMRAVENFLPDYKKAYSVALRWHYLGIDDSDIHRTKKRDKMQRLSPEGYKDGYSGAPPQNKSQHDV